MEIDKNAERYRNVFEPIVSSLGLEIYDVEYIQGQFLVRLYIRNPETKTAAIDECAQVDRALSPVFENEDWIPQKIVLEVSSPGMTRKLKTFEHFEESLGETILVHLKKKIEGEIPKRVKGQNKFTVRLKDIHDSGLVGSVEDQEITLDFENIKKATIEPDWSKMMNDSVEQ